MGNSSAMRGCARLVLPARRGFAKEATQSFNVQRQAHCAALSRSAPALMGKAFPLVLGTVDSFDLLVHVRCKSIYRHYGYNQ